MRLLTQVEFFLLIENDYIAEHPRTTGGVGGVGYTAAGYTDEEIVRKRTYISGGTYKIDNSAFFAQGSFQLTDRWLLNAGLRSDSFDNGNAAGKSFIALDNQMAYRIGTTFDVNGDGSKLGLFLGTYYLPFAANTNIRMAGGETYIQEYYVLQGIDDSKGEFRPYMTNLLNSIKILIQQVLCLITKNL